MKKLVAIIALFFVLGTGYAQTINGVEIKNLEQEYVQIVGTGKMFSTKVTISIDVGQHVKFGGGKKQVIIMGADGKPLVLNSMIDAMNFMYSAGYEYLDAYVVTMATGMGGSTNVYHYTLKRKED